MLNICCMLKEEEKEQRLSDEVDCSRFRLY